MKAFPNRESFSPVLIAILKENRAGKMLSYKESKISYFLVGSYLELIPILHSTLVYPGF